MKRKTTKPGNMRAFIYPVSKKMRKVRRKGTKNESWRQSTVKAQDLPEGRKDQTCHGKGHDPWNLSASYTGQKPERDCEELYKLGVAAVDQQRRNGRRRIMAQEGVNND